MNKPLRIGIIAGEKSGDNLGAALMEAIQLRQPQTRFEGIGGPAMLGRGFHSFFSMERLSVMGFVEPLGRLPELLRMERQLKRHFLAAPPDVFIGIDSPGFNLRFEEPLRRAGIPTVHYVSPSVWAYREQRIHRIKRAVDLMLVLFPFEEEIYRRHGIAVEFLGHPLADQIEPADRKQECRQRLGLADAATVLALLPGSRANELKRLGPVFLETARRLRLARPGLQVLIPCAGPERMAQMQRQLEAAGLQEGFQLLPGDAQGAMAAADVVLLSSGTATLEALLLKRPMVICYRLAPLTYAIASRMLKVPYVGLPNLLAGRQLVPEFIQDQVTADNLAESIEGLLRDLADGRVGADLIGEFELIHQRLRRGASERAAAAVLRLCGGR